MNDRILLLLLTQGCSSPGVWGSSLWLAKCLLIKHVPRMCTDEVGSSCRLIDNVKIVGSAEPMKLYVMDLNPLAMTVDPKPPARHFSLKLRFMVPPPPTAATQQIPSQTPGT